MKSPAKPEQLDCACAAIRHVARLVTQIYEEELREHLAVPQFALLSVLEHRPGCSQALLSKALDLDKTTLSRNLKLMQSKGWIGRSSSEDRRQRGYELTAAGVKLLKAAIPRWRRAQHRLRAAMTTGQWDAMWQTVGNIKAAATRAHTSTQ